jgi:hypothetical protein
MARRRSRSTLSQVPTPDLLRPAARLGPEDFDPWRAEITDCACDVCTEIAYAMSDVLDFYGERRDACTEMLLASLLEGWHRRMTHAERCARAKVQHEERMAAARARGASDLELFGMEYGHTWAGQKILARARGDYGDFVHGIGLGITIGGVGGTVPPGTRPPYRPFPPR